MNSYSTSFIFTFLFLTYVLLDVDVTDVRLLTSTSLLGRITLETVMKGSRKKSEDEMNI